jgi:hypothetical protein
MPRVYRIGSLTVYLFQPREAEAERRGGTGNPRSNPLHRVGGGGGRKRLPGSGTLPTLSARPSSSHATGPEWHSHQLRHNAATRLRRECGGPHAVDPGPGGQAEQRIVGADSPGAGVSAPDRPFGVETGPGDLSGG